MSKFVLNYSCGHGTFVENIVGKVSERQRKADWYEANRLCSECFKAKKRDEEAKAPKTFDVRLVNMASGYSVWVEVFGQLEENKEALCGAGYLRGKSFFGPSFCFAKEIPIGSSDEAVVQSFEQERVFLVGLGYTLHARLNRKDDVSRIQAITNVKRENPMPECPWFFQDIRAKYNKPIWNGKVYGIKNQYNIYVCGDKHNITNEQREELTAWLDKSEARKKAIQQAQEQN